MMTQPIIVQEHPGLRQYAFPSRLSRYTRTRPTPEQEDLCMSTTTATDRGKPVARAPLPANAALTGAALLHDPMLNKGTAYSRDERRKLGLEGLLPHAVETLDRQVERVMAHLDTLEDDLQRYVYLIDLEARNETVFYKAIMSDP